MLAGGVALLVVGTVLGEPARVEWQNVSPNSVLALGYLIGAGSILAMTAYVWLLQVAPPTRVATYAYVNPVIAILLGTVILDEPLTPRVGISAALIVAAVVLITRSAGPKRAPVAQASRANVPAGVVGVEKTT
jgi:drug/metabolite transporter (DMT)-like permease